MDFVVIDGLRYSKDFKICFGCDKCVIKEANIIEGVESLADFAFRDCKFLEKVIIPSTLKEINHYAFDGCTSLEKLVFYPLIKNIPADAVKDCPKLSIFSDILAVSHDKNEPIMGYKLPTFYRYNLNDFNEFLEDLKSNLDGVFSETEIQDIIRNEVYELSFM